MTPAPGSFEQVLLRSTTLPGVLHLTWIAWQQGQRLVQVYVNGVLYDVSMDAGQREMWLHTDGLGDVGVELRMVEADEAWMDQSGRPAAELAMSRDEGLPIDARVVVSVDGADAAEGRLWDAMDFRSGFGGLFGEGEFGHDAAGAPGSGMGEFGVGAMGMDGVAWRWAGKLARGTHALSLRVEDGSGRTIAQVGGARVVEIEANAKPASGVSVDGSFVMHIQPRGAARSGT
ncbi:MAG: hypothetical protein WC058_03315 [Phycisphaeraceae bacterium]